MFELSSTLFRLNESEIEVISGEKVSTCGYITTRDGLTEEQQTYHL